MSLHSMKTARGRRACLSALAAGLLGVVAATASAPAAAQPYPARPITLVVPFAVGGSADLVARRFAQAFQEVSGATVTVENRTGAGATVGIQHAAKAKPDGYTLLVGSDSILIGPLTRKSLPYSLKDFVPIARLRTANAFLSVHSGVPAQNVQQLVALAKDKPGELRYASGGIATILHLAGEQFAQGLGLNLVHVPYKGAAPAITDVAAGHAEMAWTGAAELPAMLKEGRVRVLGMMGERRSPTLPNVPTMAEQGHPELVVVSWNGVFAPAGTPPDVLAWLNEKVSAAALSPTFQKGGESLEIDAGGVLKGPAFVAFLDKQRERYKAIIEKGRIELTD